METQKIKNTKLLIVEDEPLIAQDIKRCCQNIGYEVIGIASRSERALDLLHSQEIDAVIMDINIKGEMDGIDLAKIINEKYDLPFIFLTSYADRDTLDRAKGTFPYGYILKPFDENDLLTSLEIAIFKYKNRPDEQKGIPLRESIMSELGVKISIREYEIIQSMFEGLNNQQMAHKFFVSENTIKSHIKRIYVKLNVHKRSELLKSLLTL